MPPTQVVVYQKIMNAGMDFMLVRVSVCGRQCAMRGLSFSSIGLHPMLVDFALSGLGRVGSERCMVIL
jgi:hypothetical protein